jgi:hypothetical protein
VTEIPYRKRLMALLEEQGISCQSHEDKFTKYVPDLSWAGHRTDGWIEVKYQERAPKTLASIHHWTMGQQNWLINAGQKGSGHCYLWLGTDEEHYVWSWTALAKIRKSDFRNMAVKFTVVHTKSIESAAIDFGRRARDVLARVTVL